MSVDRSAFEWGLASVAVASGLVAAAFAAAVWIAASLFIVCHGE